MKIITRNSIILTLIFMEIFFYTNIAFSFNLRVPLLNISEETTEKQSSKGKTTFLGIIRNIFSSYLIQGIPLRLLDVGTGYDAKFTFRVNEIFEGSNIKARVSGMAPNIMSEYIRQGEKEGIELRCMSLESLASIDTEKGKYLIITINAPDFIMDVDRFFDNLDFLLAKGGIIILRPSVGYDNESFKEDVAILLKDSIWDTQNFKAHMEGLPTGNDPLIPPLLIWRTSDYDRRELLLIGEAISFYPNLNSLYENL